MSVRKPRTFADAMKQSRSRLGVNRKSTGHAMTDAMETSAAVHAKFTQAGQLLRELVAGGFSLYVDGTGNLHLMIGPSHDENHRPRQDAIVASENIPGLSGGDW